MIKRLDKIIQELQSLRNSIDHSSSKFLLPYVDLMEKIVSLIPTKK
ncbi:MAG TPA: hypothetical protein PK863_01905 [Candidatus Dojkabacteria bacterium]|nr:hypothetical protein [Candidatus Dojkabacteria bacterium]